jgi:hypothetical protein
MRLMIGFDAGRVAIHDKPDRPGRRDDRGLRVAETMFFTKSERRVPGG